MLMHSGRRDELLHAAPKQSHRPFISTRNLTQKENTQKIAFDCKESDFIKRIKRAKSIMLAHKNRKQKNVLSHYFKSSSCRKKQNQSSLKNNNNANVTTPIDKPIQQCLNVMQQKIENFLFPPVHSSLPIYLSINKKLKSRSLRMQALLQNPTDISAYLFSQSKKNEKERLKIHSKIQQLDLQCLKQCLKLSDMNRKKINQTQNRSSNFNVPHELKIAKSIKFIHLQTDFKRKKLKYNRRSITEETQFPLQNEIGGWQYSHVEYQNNPLEQENI